MNLLTKIKFLISRDKANMLTIPEFLHANKDLLIIICDPKTDKIIASYRDKHVTGQIKSPLGKKSKVVKDVLKYSRFNESVDQWLTSIMETLHLPTWKANSFFQFLDGALYAIAKSLRKKRTNERVGTPSPYVKK